MSKYTKRVGQRFPRIAGAAARLSCPILDRYASIRRLYSARTKFAQEKIAAGQEALSRGEKIYVLGLGCGGHNAGAGLVAASLADGIEVLANHEEERFLGEKHYRGYPQNSIASALQTLNECGVSHRKLFAAVATWDYPRLLSSLLSSTLDEFPSSLTMLNPQACNSHGMSDIASAFNSPKCLGRQLGYDEKFPILSLNHHDNHASMAFGTSPFATSREKTLAEKTLIAVIDGMGDASSISIYEARDGEVALLYRNQSCFDSLGQLFLYLSSSQGGWPPLSSEGRYMGAAAWGTMCRLTNPYYKALRELIYFAPEGQVYLNRRLANWHRGGSMNPYTSDLVEILGEPILPDDMWDPDHVLSVEDIEHAPITRDRVDKAAATQLLFEDVVFHVLGHWLRTTAASQLVLTGGTALNCVANMRMLESFNQEWYERYVGRSETLQLWVPPMPGDAGVPLGAAYHFAYLAGARPKRKTAPLQHAFFCGHPATKESITSTLQRNSDIRYQHVGNIRDTEGEQRVADLMAFIVSQGGVIGIHQGEAETGPRALGHRSILADPTNPATLKVINERVKHREAIRPLAPMTTLEAAKKYFHLAEGAAADNFNAYNYMVLTAAAKDIASTEIPAVVHRDGTARLQIVRRETNPLIHAYLRSMGNYVGAEVSVNTSLNVGAPIAQTPDQAIAALRKSLGLHGVFVVDIDGNVIVVWHHVDTETKDCGRQLRTWLRKWEERNDERVIVSWRTVIRDAMPRTASKTTREDSVTATSMLR